MYHAKAKNLKTPDYDTEKADIRIVYQDYNNYFYYNNTVCNNTFLLKDKV